MRRRHEGENHIELAWVCSKRGIRGGRIYAEKLMKYHRFICYAGTTMFLHWNTNCYSNSLKSFKHSDFGRLAHIISIKKKIQTLIRNHHLIRNFNAAEQRECTAEKCHMKCVLLFGIVTRPRCFIGPDFYISCSFVNWKCELLVGNGNSLGNAVQITEAISRYGKYNMADARESEVCVHILFLFLCSFHVFWC